jgi:hypothetical protein
VKWPIFNHLGLKETFHIHFITMRKHRTEVKKNTGMIINRKGCGGGGV